MPQRDHEVRTADGRVLSVVEGGALDGPAIVVHHGTPSGRLLYPPAVADAQARGLRLVGYDRPGYGGSSPQTGRRVADAAADVAAIADALGLERFATWGASGGGPHALACGARLAGRCTAVATLAGVAPYDADGLDWLAGQGEDNVREWEAALAGRDALEAFCSQHAERMRDATPAALVEAMRTLLSPPDVAVTTFEVGEFLVASTTDALRPGVEGWMEDDYAFMAPWGFVLEEVAVPVLLWQGEQDLMVPPAHGRWIAGRIPGVDARISPEDGHLTLLETRLPSIHAWLAEQL